MRALALLVALALSSCSATFAVRHPHARTPLPYLLADVAAFSVGSCVGLDGQYHERDPHDRQMKMTLGYGLAALVWLPMWFVNTR